MFDFNLEQFKYFYIVAVEKSMTKAADILHVTQPAVTASVKKLEEELGYSLFIRSNRGLTLTPEGELLFVKVKMMISIMDDAVNELDEYKTLRKGNIRIGASATITQLFLIDAIEKYKKDYPGIKIEIINGLTSSLKNDLNEGKLDLLICNDDQHGEKIKETSYVFAKHRDYDGAALIVQRNGAYTRKQMDEFMILKNISFAEDITVVNQELACIMADRQLGICFAYDKLVKKYPNLIRVPNIQECRIGLFLIQNNWSKNTTAVKTFVEYLKKNV